uniref:Uncharacterized protein n=1 Tax=Cyanothece sp. (strain PCC 7425 / ATCC 29141) TaxID=395961 RepID=B8HWK1_CYAP4
MYTTTFCPVAGLNICCSYDKELIAQTAALAIESLVLWVLTLMEEVIHQSTTAAQSAFHAGQSTAIDTAFHLLSSIHKAATTTGTTLQTHTQLISTNLSRRMTHQVKALQAAIATCITQPFTHQVTQFLQPIRVFLYSPPTDHS